MPLRGAIFRGPYGSKSMIPPWGLVWVAPWSPEGLWVSFGEASGVPGGAKWVPGSPRVIQDRSLGVAKWVSGGPKVFPGKENEVGMSCAQRKRMRSHVERSRD